MYQIEEEDEMDVSTFVCLDLDAVALHFVAALCNSEEKHQETKFWKIHNPPDFSRGNFAAITAKRLAECNVPTATSTSSLSAE